MLGMGLDELRTRSEPAPGDAPAVPITQRGHDALPSSASPAPGPASFQKTMLGVARPGVAPLQPATPVPPPTAPVTPAAEPDEDLAPPGVPKKLPWAFLLSGAAVLSAAGLLATLGLPGTGASKVYVSGFEEASDGRDRLHFSCAKCENGASITLGSERATFQDRSATLLAKPLAVGENQLSIALDEAGAKETLTLSVPVIFRVSTRFQDGPSAAVAVDVVAIEGAEVTIEGQLIQPKTGKFQATFPLPDDAKGESDRNVALAKSYSVTVKAGGKSLSANAEVRGKLARLWLDTPARHHQLSGKPLTVSGRTDPGATVTSGGVTKAAGPTGDFSLTLSDPTTLKELTVTARTKSLLPREVSLELGGAPIGDNFTGKVVESRISDGRTTTLLELPSGCADPPCLVRALYGERVALKPGQKAHVVGTQSGATLRAAILEATH